MSERNVLRSVLLATVAFVLLVVPWLVHSETPVPKATPVDVSKIDFSKISEDDIRKTEEHRDALRANAQSALEAQAQVNDSQTKTLEDLRLDAAKTKEQFEAYRDAAETQIAIGNKAITALAKEKTKHHRAQWILVALWLAVVALVVTKLPLAAKMYGLYIGAALALGGIAFIFLWL